MSALDVLAAASVARVTITLDGDGLILEAPKLPPDVVALLKTVKPDLLRVLAARNVAQAALGAGPPADCGESHWKPARSGLERFIGEGWGDQAVLLRWTAEELYRLPPLWSRIDLTGAAWLVGSLPTTSSSSRGRGRSSSFAGSAGSTLHDVSFVPFVPLFPGGDCGRKQTPMHRSSARSFTRMRSPP